MGLGFGLGVELRLARVACCCVVSISACCRVERRACAADSLRRWLTCLGLGFGPGLGCLGLGFGLGLGLGSP